MRCKNTDVKAASTSASNNLLPKSTEALKAKPSGKPKRRTKIAVVTNSKLNSQDVVEHLGKAKQHERASGDRKLRRGPPNYP